MSRTPEERTWAKILTSLGLSGIGLLFLLTFVLPTHPWPYRRTYGRPLVDDAVIFFGAILLGVLIIVSMVTLYVVAIRRAWPPRPMRLAGNGGLVWGLTLYGAGAGMSTGWFMQIANWDGMWMFPIMMGIPIIFLAFSERGLGVALGLLGTWVFGSVVGLIRLELGRSSRTWHHGDLIAASLVTGLLVMLFYMVLRGFIRAHLGQAREERTPALATPSLPLELLARDELYELRVEAPGLSSAEEVEVKVEGDRIWLSISRPAPDPARVVFSNRLTGRLTFQVLLPGPVQEMAESVRAEDGLLSVVLVPKREKG